MIKKVLLASVVLLLLAGGAGAAFLWKLDRDLPQIMKIEDYRPSLVSEVYARGGEKIGEFFNESGKRILTPYEKLPKHLVQAFLAAEDDQFFQHKGINYQAILRAMLVNLKAGHTVQGGSTITQQVAKTFFLSSERTLIRKIKEAMLAYRLEEHLRKEDILYLYLNQIFFGAESYGVAAAAQTYFRKPLSKLTTAEAAMLAGLPQAPSRYSPIKNPQIAKDRQRHVLHRMAEVGYISKEEEKKAADEPITVYIEREYNEVAPFYVETLRQMLVQELGESTVLDSGIKIYTSLDYKGQIDAQKQVREGLKTVDKRQGYRGPLRNIKAREEINAFLLSTRKQLERDKADIRVITKEGNVLPDRPLELFQKKDAAGNVVSNLPEYVKPGKEVEAIVTEINDRWGLVKVRFAETQALMDIGDMRWARKPDAEVGSDNAARVEKPSSIFNAGDVILVKVMAEVFASERLQKELAGLNKKGKNKKPVPLEVPKDMPRFNDYAYVTLEQEPLVEGALLSFDQKTQDIVAMVGGYDYKRSKFNRAIQAARQTGSAFKAIIYLSALDKGWTPGRVVADAPVVFDMESEANEGQEGKAGSKGASKGKGKDDEVDDVKKWKPHNYGNKFEGDMLFRQALIQSMNIPTVKILQDVGINWAMDYARRLGVFSPLNADLSLSLGSSGVTLYEMTKVFSQIGRMGKRTRPVLVHKILDKDGKEIRTTLSLDRRFQKEIEAVDRVFEEKRKALAAQGPLPTPEAIPTDDTAEAEGAKQALRGTPKLYFSDPDQLIRPTTAYLITNLLSATITDEGGTAARARALGRPVAGKTGTTSGYFDTWFVGYTPQYVTGVWVGFDQEKSLGVGEAGGRTALPIWLEYMKNLHQNIPPTGFTVPEGIVFANIDKKTGKLASASSKEVAYQAFVRGTEPKDMSGSPSSKEDSDFYKEDLIE